MSPAESIEMRGCRLALCRVDGPEARELFVHARPLGGSADPGEQADAIYRAIAQVLGREKASAASIVSETVFLRDLRADLGQVRAARRQALGLRDALPPRAATTEIEQPPLDEGARLEVSLQAILPIASPLRTDRLEVPPACRCAECAGSHGLRVPVGDEIRLYAAGLNGAGTSAHEQSLGMFSLAEELLQRAGMDFGDVIRTWIHLRDIDRDYADLNRARRSFFEARGIDPPPASTGIGGGPAAPEHDLCLGLYAVRSARSADREVMTTPTLNEATSYGSDFVRGMRVAERNKVALHVSGTASIDEAGRSVHAEDFEGQAERMLLNVAVLLRRQGAGFGDVVSAITYLKRPADAGRLRQKLREAGLEGVPNALVAAPICRPELLCEMEVLAVLPVAERTA